MKNMIESRITEIEDFLKAYGGETLYELVTYRSSGHFLIGSVLTGCVCCALLVRWQWLAGFLGFVCGMFLPTIILYLSNEKDNDVILKDLKWLYETISVQLQAGLSIHQALAESEGLIQNKRLRTALHRLAAQLVRGDDMIQSLDLFEKYFRNHYISSFCLILRQMQDSGYAVKLLEDIRIQIEEMERMQLHKKKEVLEMQLQMFQMLLFIGVLVLVMYGCILAAIQNINYL
jgi:pilus assembly protein TadC